MSAWSEKRFPNCSSRLDRTHHAKGREAVKLLVLPSLKNLPIPNRFLLPPLAHNLSNALHLTFDLQLPLLLSALCNQTPIIKST